MSSWWVNHKQTAQIELDEGYIWSPKKTKDGKRNETYLNLTRAKIGEMIFSYADGKVGAIGRVASGAEVTEKPSQFESKGEHWNDTGWMVKVKWAILTDPLSPKAHLDRIVPLLPTKNSPLRNDGNGSQNCYLAEISEQLASVLLHLTTDIDEDIHTDLEDIAEEIAADEEEEKIAQSELPATTREQLILARVGQGAFRAHLERLEAKCRVTGLLDKRLLIASHIKPWKNSDNKERLDGHNGLLLSPHIDKLFDRGWISFSDGGRILVRNEKIKSALTIWSINPNTDLGQFSKKQKQYLEYHRDVVFR